MARPRSGALAVVVLLAATACATAAPQSVERAAEGQRYRVTGTVLESPDHGPQLCKLVKDSNPPQCEGMEIVGWDWSKVDAESNSGTTWGGYTLVGTYDGERFTLTEPAAKPSGPRPPPEDDVTFDTPCPEPEGGWRVVDESRFGMEAQHLVDKRTRSAPDFAGMWVDYPYLDPAELKDPAAAERSGALRNFVLNVRFTGDLAGREEWIREVWGGALCVSQAKYTLQELSKIEQELQSQHGDDVLYSNADEYANHVELEMYVATDELQDGLDAKYGAGVVLLDGWLEPVE